MNIFKKISFKIKEKNKKKANRKENHKNENISNYGNFYNQSNNIIQNPNEIGNKISRKLFTPDVFTNSQNADYNWQEKRNQINKKATITNDVNFQNNNSVIHDNNLFPFEEKYTEKNGDLFFEKKNNSSNLKIDVDQKSINNFINSENKTHSIFSSDKLYTLEELTIYKIPLTKTYKVFEKGLVFFKIKDVKDLTAQEANVLIFKNPYDLPEKSINLELFKKERKNAKEIKKLNSLNNQKSQINQNINSYSNTNIAQNFSYEPKPVYRFSNISSEGEVVSLNCISFDVWSTEIIAILSTDNLSNYLFANILKEIEKPTQGSIYFNENILNNNPQVKWINLKETDDDNKQVSKENMIKEIKQINYLDICDDRNTKINQAFENICNFFNVNLDRNLLDNLVQLTNFYKYIDESLINLEGISLDKFNGIADILIGKKIIFIENLINGLDDYSKQNLLSFLQNFMSNTKTASLLITNDIKDASLLSSRFVVLKDGKIFANFTRWEIPQEYNSLDMYLSDVILNNSYTNF